MRSFNDHAATHAMRPSGPCDHSMIMRLYMTCGLSGHAIIQWSCFPLWSLVTFCGIFVCVWIYFLFCRFCLLGQNITRHGAQQLYHYCLRNSSCSVKQIEQVSRKKTNGHPFSWGVEKHPLLISYNCPRTWSLSLVSMKIHSQCHGHTTLITHQRVQTIRTNNINDKRFKAYKHAINAGAAW